MRVRRKNTRSMADPNPGAPVYPPAEVVFSQMDAFSPELLMFKGLLFWPSHSR